MCVTSQGYVDDLPVVVHPGVRPKTDVAWTDLSDVAFLVNGGRYVCVEMV